jgi:hypothetical protein
VPEGFEGNINQHIVAIKTKDIAISEAIAAWLNLDIAERLASRRSTGGTRPALDYPALLSIPVVFDERIPQLMRIAVENHQAQLAKADALLSKIDEILLEELGITRQPEPAGTLESRMFRRRLSEVTGDRFDPEYFEDRYRRLLRSIGESKYPLRHLAEACSLLTSGKTPARSDYSEEATNHPIIKVASYTGDEIDLSKVDYASVRQPYAARQGDIFILSAAHQPDFVGRFVKFLAQEPEVSTSFVGELICARADESAAVAGYLFAVLGCSVFQTLMNREKRGQTSHIYSRDIGRLLIPLPPRVNDQVRIAHRISEIRTEAKLLRERARADLESTKREIEALVFGNAGGK